MAEESYVRLKELVEKCNSSDSEKKIGIHKYIIKTKQRIYASSQCPVEMVSTGKEAEFSLDQSCIDIEKLMLRVICCNRYTRLLVILKEVVKNSRHICRVAGDIQLQYHVEEPVFKLLQSQSDSPAKADLTSNVKYLTLRGSSAGKGLGQSPSGRRLEPQQGHWRHYKPAASPGPRGTNRGGPALKQRDPVGTASRVRKATPGNH
ncbi:hypothetical protein MTR67_016873, partial [Solanum verrucosum]